MWKVSLFSYNDTIGISELVEISKTKFQKIQLLIMSCCNSLQRKYLIILLRNPLSEVTTEWNFLQHQSQLLRNLYARDHLPNSIELQSQKKLRSRNAINIKIFYVCRLVFLFLSLHIYFYTLQKESQGGEYGPPGQQPGQPIDSYGAPHPGPSGPY